ncbi:MAG: hypothetical protein PVG79_17025 [Gemmatimonadales bacterium]
MGPLHKRLRFRTRYVVAVATAALFPLAGCGGRDRAPTVERTDSAAITIVESAAPAWGPDETWRVSGPITSIGTVDGPPESQLYWVMGAVRLEDGRIAVANHGSSEIRLYGSDGRWIRSMGRRGDGPGEFRSIRGMQLLPPDTLLLSDDRGPRVTSFTADGAVVESRRLASRNNPFKPPDHRLPNGCWLDLERSSEIEGYQRRRNTYITWSEGDSATDTVLAHEGQEYLIYTRHRGDQYIGRGAVVVPFGGQDLTAVGPGRVALSDGQAYDIAVAEIDGREFRVRRAIERRPVTQAAVTRFVDEYVARYPLERQRQVRDRFDDVTPPSLMPTHSALAFDPSANLWVENYRVPWDTDSPRTWSVFDPDGRWLGDVEIPQGLRVHEIGEDYIAGVERDDMGVEYVRLYAVVKE